MGNFLGPFITPPLLLMYTSDDNWYVKVIPDLGPGGFGELYKRVFKQLGLSLFLPLVWHHLQECPAYKTYAEPAPGRWTEVTDDVSQCYPQGRLPVEAFKTRSDGSPCHHMADL